MEDRDEAPRGAFLLKWLPSSPKDTVCLAVAVAGTGFIVVNALFLQSGPHPAPIFSVAEASAPAMPVAESIPLPPKRQPSTRIPAATLPAAVTPTTTASAPAKTATRDSRHDPIADLLEPSNRTMAVQRALTEFGYGQIKPTGTIGPDTKAAIEKFERERKLPVTGKVSERLTQELSAMKGAPL